VGEVQETLCSLAAHAPVGIGVSAIVHALPSQLSASGVTGESPLSPTAAHHEVDGHETLANDACCAGVGAVWTFQLGAAATACPAHAKKAATAATATGRTGLQDISRLPPLD
jgi:hypothetical protein